MREGGLAMSDSSISDFKYSKGSISSFLESLSELPFPSYILADEPPHRRLVQGQRGGQPGPNGESITYVTLTYLPYPSENTESQILGITSSVEVGSADDWPYMPIYHNENFARRMMDYVRLSFPDADDVDLETLRFFHLIAKAAEIEEYQTKSGLRFHLFHVGTPFPLSRAYVHINNASLHVIVMGAGFSHSEFLTVLDLLILARGNEDVLRRQMQRSGYRL